MKPLLDRVKELTLFRDGETVLAAVSGGADSVALFHLLMRLPVKLFVAHLNHQLRGADSDGDELFVAELCREHQVPLHRTKVDVARLARDQGLTLEEAGREARYRFLYETARAVGAESIALAHHRDDQAETVLMRLLRGSGGSGLCAMREENGILKRPLLSVSREEIERYLKDGGVTWRTDASNLDTTLTRNSIRHELIPFLKRYNPAVCERLAATAQALGADEELLERVAREAFARHGSVEGDTVELDIEGVRAELTGLRLRLYRLALTRVRGGLERIARTHLEALDRLVCGARPHARLSLPGGSRAIRSYGRLTIAAASPPLPSGWECAIAGEGIYELPGGGAISVTRALPPGSLDPGSRNVAYLSLEAVPFPWLVRTFLPGDRFRPLGMKGEQKVKDFFINEKVPLPNRRRVPLLFSAGSLMWVVGYRMSEDARVTGACERVLRAEILDFTP